MHTRSISSAVTKGTSSPKGFRRSSTGGVYGEASFVSKSGTATPYFFTGHQVIFDERPCIPELAVDITEVEEALRYQARLLGTVSEAIFSTDSDHQHNELEQGGRSRAGVASGRGVRQAKLGARGAVPYRRGNYPC
jgi:hypothetical protein